MNHTAPAADLPPAADSPPDAYVPAPPAAGILLRGGPNGRKVHVGMAKHADGQSAAPVAAAPRMPAAEPFWWPAAALPLLALAAFVPGLGNGFVHWDDVPYILENPLLRDFGGLARIWQPLGGTPQYYPLTFTSYWMEYQLWGAWATGYFAVNVLLHAANSLLVFYVARAVGAGRGAAWLVAALFAVHPVQVASVAWLAQRKNTLAGVFYFSTILIYLRYCRRGELALYLAALLLFACALLSKTMTLPLPLSLILAERLLLGRRGAGPWLRAAPFLLLALGVGFITVLAERALAPVTAHIPPQPLLAGAAVWAYLAKIAWPATLLALYPRWTISAANPLWWLPLSALVAAVLAVWFWRQRLRPAPTWGLAHFLLALLPTLGFLPFGYLLSAPYADHFLYFSLPGLFLAVVVLAGRIVARGGQGARVAAIGVGAAVLAALLVRTWWQVPIWHDGVRLWSHTLAHNPTAPPAHNNLGIALGRRGELAAALASYQRAADLDRHFWLARSNVAFALRDLGRTDESLAAFRGIVADAPNDANARFNLACMLVRCGRPDEAFAEFAAAVRIDPHFTQAYTNWGVALLENGRPDEAVERLTTALRLDPADSLAHFNLALALAARGDLAGAVAHYERAAALQPANSQIRTNLGLMLAGLGRIPEAVENLEAALALDPDDVLAHVNLGALAVHLRQPERAERHFRAALERAPENVEALNNLGTLLAQRGRWSDARPCLERAVQLAPDHANAHFMLGAVLLALDQPADARAQLERAVTLQPDDAEAHERLAAALHTLGEREAARTALDRAEQLARDAGNVELLRQIETRRAEYTAAP